MSISKTDFLNRIKYYCAKGERCTGDVITKLTEWNVSNEDIDHFIKLLQNENFLDETRYIRSYVSEKWNLNQWGRLKIEAGLKQKKVDDKLIATALKDIDEKDYLTRLHELLHKKYKDVKSENKNDDAKRVMMYAISKGYEEGFVEDWLIENVLYH